ncbi:MAG TPA: DHHA1 domain-containing protein, partial [Candidatus Doudnabacteria bacterium]|nr:DHHA1 domain-containing protein [Candidatus Doudnabacteria bacterium]
LGENRILVKFGLKVLQKTRWLGLRLLMENAGIDLNQKNPDSVTLGFAIAPRINAAGRLEHANVALQLLTTNDYATAIDLANRIEEINRRRQDITARIVSEAKEKAEAIRSRKILVLSDPSWAKGVVGIVAGKLADHYKKPVIVLERGEKESTGSARSSRGFDIVEALKACAPYLSRFGGHKEAAGLTLSNDKLDEFYVELLKYADSHWPEELPEAVLDVDAELSESDFSFDRYAEIELFEPFGAGNPKPIFTVKGTTLASYRTVGAEQNHLQLKVALGEKLIDCIGFSMGYWAGQLEVGRELDLCGELLSDSWNGTKKLKMRVIDIKIVETVDEESKVESIETNESKQQLQKTIS